MGVGWVLDWWGGGRIGCEVERRLQIQVGFKIGRRIKGFVKIRNELAIGRDLGLFDCILIVC